MDSKPFFRWLFRPVADRFAEAGISANQVTSATIVISVATGAAVMLTSGAHWALLLIPGALTLRLAFNHIDGLLAVEHGGKTDLGALLNEEADAIADFAIFAPLARVFGVNSALVIAVVFLGMFCELAGLAALRIGARREDGPMSKKVRGLMFSAAAIAIGVGVAPGPWLDAMLIAAIPLLALTVVRRTRNAILAAAKP
jgi:phosphatidylglycerophosphate synthase